MEQVFNLIEVLLLLTIIYLIINKKIKLPNVSSDQSGKKLILDSCGLIDGRIIELSNAGFIQNELILPEFVLKELQLLADGGDSHKRARARFGLDVIKELKKIDSATLTINRDEITGTNKTDDKLIILAKKLNADLYTTDYNLGKVAHVEGITVLNINEMALSMRPAVLPGENRKIKIIQKGSGRGQGVGYLEDGTMVVVDNAQKLIGKTIQVEIERYHQTESGKMIFAKITKLN